MTQISKIRTNIGYIIIKHKGDRQMIDRQRHRYRYFIKVTLHENETIQMKRTQFQKDTNQRGLGMNKKSDQIDIK